MSTAITVNGSTRSVPDALSLQALLEHLGLDPRTVVVERNGTIVRHDGLAATSIVSGDRIEVVHFVGGG